MQLVSEQVIQSRDPHGKVVIDLLTTGISQIAKGGWSVNRQTVIRKREHGDWRRLSWQYGLPHVRRVFPRVIIYDFFRVNCSSECRMNIKFKCAA